ncbi:hypothetical protein TNCV_4476781 [Trichonephila clavipes]|nr:hypothetical protein TNCV_4476781 [Trichonephila clavipes]
MTLTLQVFVAGEASEALRKFPTLKRLRKSPLSSQGLNYMIRTLEATGTLEIQPGRGRKCVAAQVVATPVEEDRSQTIGSTSVRRIAVSVDPSKDQKIL